MQNRERSRVDPSTRRRRQKGWQADRAGAATNRIATPFRASLLATSLARQTYRPRCHFRVRPKTIAYKRTDRRDTLRSTEKTLAREWRRTRLRPSSRERRATDSTPSNRRIETSERSPHREAENNPAAARADSNQWGARGVVEKQVSIRAQGAGPESI